MQKKKKWSKVWAGQGLRDYLDFEDTLCLLKWFWIDKSECRKHVMDFMALSGSGRSVQYLYNIWSHL